MYLWTKGKHNSILWLGNQGGCLLYLTHSFRGYRCPSVRDDSDDEWNDHICDGGVSFPPLQVNMNVGLQRLFQNVNAIPSTIVPPTHEPHGVGPVEQQNATHMTTNWKDAKLDNRIMEVIQQTQTIVRMCKQMQTLGKSMIEWGQKLLYMHAEIDSEDLKWARGNGCRGHTSRHCSRVEIDKCFVVMPPLVCRGLCDKAGSHMFLMTICTIHMINNKFVDELLYCYINTYCFSRILYLPACTIRRCLWKKLATTTRAYMLAKMDVCCSKGTHTKIWKNVQSTMQINMKPMESQKCQWVSSL